MAFARGHRGSSVQLLRSVRALVAGALSRTLQLLHGVCTPAAGVHVRFLLPWCMVVVVAAAGPLQLLHGALLL